LVEYVTQAEPVDQNGEKFFGIIINSVKLIDLVAVKEGEPAHDLALVLPGILYDYAKVLNLKDRQMDLTDKDWDTVIPDDMRKTVDVWIIATARPAIPEKEITWRELLVELKGE
jgi:hypothetical protein